MAKARASILACWSDCLCLLGQERVLHVIHEHPGMYKGKQVCVYLANLRYCPCLIVHV